MDHALRARLSGTAFVCVLHGDPALPPWLFELANLAHLRLVVNDPMPGAYRQLPVNAEVVRNPEPRGFAANVVPAVDDLLRVRAPTFVGVLNADLDLDPQVFGRLVGVLERDARVGIVGPVLSAPGGGATFSSGRHPTPLREFLRAAGLREGPLRTLQRAVLARSPAWRRRNATGPADVRVVPASEYLPWTCVVLRATAWSTVGPLDERFALYAEDVDWSLRAHRAGVRIALAEVGPIVHAERASAGPRADGMYEQSHLRLHRKWRWERNLAWQRRGLRLRRSPLLRRFLRQPDWSWVDAEEDEAAIARS